MLLDHGQNAPPVLGPRPSPGLPKSAYIGLGECYVGYGYKCRQGLAGSGMKVQRGGIATQLRTLGWSAGLPVRLSVSGRAGASPLS